jgi:hypothetical protein
MLGLYGLMASGLPLPIGWPVSSSTGSKTIAAKDRSRPFPCMETPCGCDSAERCFTNCCCHTAAETLAWAKARGIEPSVIDALTRRVAVDAPGRSQKVCSSAKAALSRPACGREDLDDVDAAICSDYQSLAAEPKRPTLEHTSRSDASVPREHAVSGGDAVVLKAMLACGGILAQWASFGVSLPPPQTVICDLPWPQVGVLRLVDLIALGTGGPPDLPPPRG